MYSKEEHWEGIDHCVELSLFSIAILLHVAGKYFVQPIPCKHREIRCMPRVWHPSERERDLMNQDLHMI